MRASALIFASFLLIVPAVADAVKHIKPDAYPNAFQDQVHKPKPADVQKFGSLRAAVAASAIGTKNVAVIIVQFPSASVSLTSGSRLIQSVSNIQGYFDQMATYFNEASYGKLTLNMSYFNSDTTTPLGDAAPSPGQTGVYTLANSMEYYGCGDEGIGCAGVTTPTSPSVSANGDYLIKDALVEARADHAGLNSTNFDAVVVVHAGNGNETTLSSGDIWSIFYSQEPASQGGVIGSAGGGFEEGDVVPETEASGITSPLGVMCHEFGHELGLPDLYNTGSAGGTSVVGNWDIMDSGPFIGAGANPAHPGAWSKYTLNWAVPSTITTKGSASLGPVELGSGTNMLRIPVQNGLPQEYFLVEYRSRTSGAFFDRNIPGDGLLIWHVDDAITQARGVAVTDLSLSNTVNTGIPHYGVSIVTADGVSISATQGTASNLFTAASAVFTSPRSDNFEGEPSGVSLVNIAASGASVAFDVANLAVTAGQMIKRIINFPNPAGKGYNHSRGEGYTTLQFVLGRPANDVQLNIYTVAGELVRKISKESIPLNINRSTDEKWVYEFDWDLSNGGGEKVAPGVYLWMVRADGEKKTTKAVIIR
jgi:M6 family metalloprotease-like protein